MEEDEVELSHHFLLECPAIERSILGFQFFEQAREIANIEVKSLCRFVECSERFVDS